MRSSSGLMKLLSSDRFRIGKAHDGHRSAHLLDATFADAAVFVEHQRSVGTTEETHVPSLFQDDLFTLHADIELVALMDAEDAANL
ncbi:MAG: hypothetical protein QOH48_866 [Actinomycetota bacterium]|nr:hypothetical protein [Actinomycetota bacterium]